MYLKTGKGPDGKVFPCRRLSDEYVGMYKHYSREDEEKYGVLAIKIERI